MHFYLSEGSGEGADLCRKRLPLRHSPHSNKMQVRKRLFTAVECLGFTAINYVRGYSLEILLCYNGQKTTSKTHLTKCSICNTFQL